MLDLTNKAESLKKDKFEPTPEQKHAIDHIGSDLLLSAGAGSGKTATLTDRIVKRITKDKLDIGRMLVVTFTKDAANELKSRIAKKLSSQLEIDPSNQWFTSQFVKVNSADISTIHSFCFKCIRPYFERFNLDSDVRIGETGELEILKLEAMNEVLEEFYELETPDPDFLLAVDCYSSYTDDTTLAMSLLDLHDKKLSSCADGTNILLKKHQRGTEFLTTPHGQALLTYVSRIVNHFTPLIKELYCEAVSFECNKKYRSNLEELNRVYDSLSQCLKNPTYEGICTILNSYEPKAARGGKSDSVPTFESLAYLDEIRRDAHAKLNSLKKDYFYTNSQTIDAVFEQNEKICYAIYKVLKAYEDRYQEKKRKYALCDFDDLEKLTLKLFYNEDGSISNIAREISLNYDEIYIDEYQDVNSVQDKIFRAIARNNRFMVGDIKQSIYGFRSAEPELFSAYRDSFAPHGSSNTEGNGYTIFMSDNFRCDPDIISATNYMSDYMFGNSFGFTYDKNGDILKHAKKHPQDFSPQKVELCVIDKSKISEDSCLNDLDPQAEFVAQEIKRLIENGYLPDGRKIKPGHIAILLRKYSHHADKYINALNRYGINNEFSQKISFFEKPHILLMLSILNAIDNPSKDVYLTGALHSQIFNFSLEEIVKIKKHSPDEYSVHSALNNYKGDSVLREKIDLALSNLEKFRVAIRKMNSYEALSYVMNETGFMSFCGKEERQDIIRLYNLARGYEQGAYKGLYSFLRHLDDLASKGEFEETVSSDPDNSVKLLTMHKSKGLEYEICFLCDLEKNYFAGNSEPPILFHRAIGICGYVSRDGGVVKYNNILRKCIDIASRDEAREEAMRILYVAMTRARSKLYLTAKTNNFLKDKEQSSIYASKNDPYLMYSKSSHFGIIMGARPYLCDFLDERANVTESIYERNEDILPKESIDQDYVEQIKATLAKRFDFNYEYSHLDKIPSKLSISTLHPSVLDDEDNQENQKRYSIESLPKFTLDKEKHISGADRGTATHIFLQFCDFENLKKNGVECELKRLLDNSFISQQVGEIINKEHIEKFISSKMFNELLSAKKIIREFRFNIMLPANEFSKELDLGQEQVLVQGVTDCLFESQAGEFILVDYKTDNVTEENYVSELTRKHSSQLTYYKRACELMFERPVSKAIIYSVPLAKTVEIK